MRATREPALNFELRAENIMARLFAYSLVAVTYSPILICWLFLLHFPHAGGALGFVLTLGGAHVALTLYLTSDANVRRKLATEPVNGVLIPLAILLAVMLAITASPAWVALSASVAYSFYQAFHFGRQNIGVYVLTSLAAGQGPILKSERLAINLATACGMLGAITIFMPNLIRGTLYESTIDSMPSRLLSPLA